MSTIKVDNIDSKDSTGNITIARPLVATLTAGSINNLNNLLTPANASVTAAKMATTDTLPAWSGINLTALNANNLGSGTVSRARGGTGLTTAGASGQVLTSDGTNWTSAAAGGGATTLIARNTFTNAATIEITSGFDSSLFDTYRWIVHCKNIGGSGWSGMGVRTSSNGGSSFDSSGGNYAHAGQQAQANNNAAYLSSASAHNILILTGNAHTTGFVSDIKVYRPDLTDRYTTVMAETLFYSSGYSTYARAYSGGERLSNGLVDALQLCQFGSMTLNGTYQFIGYKKA